MDFADLLHALKGDGPRGLRVYTPFYGCYSVMIYDENRGFFTVETIRFTVSLVCLTRLT